MLSSFDCYLFRLVRTTFAQLRSSHCQLLNSYKAHTTAGMTDVCPDCGVAPHSVEHLFQCPVRPTQLTTTYGMTQTWWLIFSSSTTTDEGEKIRVTTTTTTTTTTSVVVMTCYIPRQLSTITVSDL